MSDMQHGGTLVIQPLPGIGDMVWHLPLLRAIAKQAPQGRITLLCKPSAQALPLLRETGFLEDIIPLTKASTGWTLLETLKQRHFKQAWVLHHSNRYYMPIFFAGIPERYGYGFGWQRLWLTDNKTFIRPQRHLHTLERISAYAALQGFKISAEDRYFNASKELCIKMHKKYASMPKPWIAFGIGATEENRRWPLEHFATLATDLSKRGKCTLFLCCSSAEEQRAHRIVSLLSSPHKNVLPITTLKLEEIMALLWLTSLFVGNDSGLMNIAATLGITTFGLFGASPKLSYVPNLEGITPPFLERPSGESMTAITPAMVLSALLQKHLLPL